MTAKRRSRNVSAAKTNVRMHVCILSNGDHQRGPIMTRISRFYYFNAGPERRGPRDSHNAFADPRMRVVSFSRAGRLSRFLSRLSLRLQLLEQKSIVSRIFISVQIGNFLVWKTVQHPMAKPKEIIAHLSRIISCMLMTILFWFLSSVFQFNVCLELRTQDKGFIIFYFSGNSNALQTSRRLN